MALETVASIVNPINAVPAIVGKLGFDQVNDAKKAKEAARKLEEQRRAQLAKEAADREAARKRAETTGQRVGLSARAALVGQTGAGSGNTAFGSGPGTLFGN